MIEETLMGLVALLPLLLVIVVAVRLLRKKKKPELTLVKDEMPKKVKFNSQQRIDIPKKKKRKSNRGRRK